MLVSLGASSLSVATPVVVSDGKGVDIWVAPKVFTSLICHLYSVSTPGAGVRIVKKKPLGQPITKIHASVTGWGTISPLVFIPPLSISVLGKKKED